MFKYSLLEVATEQFPTDIRTVLINGRLNVVTLC